MNSDQIWLVLLAISSLWVPMLFLALFLRKKDPKFEGGIYD